MPSNKEQKNMGGTRNDGTPAATLGDGAMAPPVAVARRRHPVAPTKGAPRPAPTNTVRAGKDWAAALEDLGSDDSDDD